MIFLCHKLDFNKTLIGPNVMGDEGNNLFADTLTN